MNRKKIVNNILSLISILCFLAGSTLIVMYFYQEYHDNTETKRLAIEADAILDKQLAEKKDKKDELKTVPNIPLPELTADGTISGMNSPDSRFGNFVNTAPAFNINDYLRGVLTIERFGTKVAVYESMDMAVLRYGLGHYPQTGWANQNKQIFLAGHNNRELRVLKDIKTGDKITFKSSEGVTDYFVKMTKIVNEKDGGVVKSGDLGSDELVLMTCYPFNSIGNEKERFLVYAYKQ
jgi:LPXTG-site transpeptidase (sortase) family protein